MNYGFELNLLFNLSKIDECRESITGTYKGTNFKNKFMPFALKQIHIIEIKEMYDFRGKIFKKLYLMDIKIDAKYYNFTMKMIDHKNIKVYWLIYHNDIHFFKNERNYRQFFNDCRFLDAN